MHQDNNTNNPKNKRGFLSFFSTPTPKPSTPHHKYLNQILKLEEQVQLLEFDKNELKEKLKHRITKSITDQHHKNTTEAPKHPRKQPILNTLDYLPSLTKNTLEYILGRGEYNNLIIQDLSKEPQLLIAGKTGSGKSVTLFNILVSICYSNTPKTLKISLIDPKILSFGDKRIVKTKFLNESPSIGDFDRAEEILKSAYDSMMNRYQVMLKKGVKDYRKIGLHAHVIFIDEVFELLEGHNGKEILSLITRIASLGRAGGVHLVMATQSPRAKTLSGTLKANLEFIGHRMSNPTESKLIELLEAHRLRGKGDGLKILNGQSEVTRFQATFIDIELNETYQYFTQNILSNQSDLIQTQYRPNTHPIQVTQNTENMALRELKEHIIETMDEDRKIKPKAHFIDIKKRDEISRWSKAINELRADEIIAYQNGKGYYVVADYYTALSVVGGV
jgi:S-DNA-T family DNA segregation ATPase FtsK/SpoIIIE